MAKDIEWGLLYGEGTIVAECDYCGNVQDAYEFEDSDIDYRAAQDELRSLGWVSLKVGGKWYDFCCPACKNKFLDERVKNIT